MTVDLSLALSAFDEQHLKRDAQATLGDTASRPDLVSKYLQDVVDRHILEVKRKMAKELVAVLVSADQTPAADFLPLDPEKIRILG